MGKNLPATDKVTTPTTLVDGHPVIRTSSLDQIRPDPCRWCSCGGEQRYARRWEAGLLISYLQCMFCGSLKPMLSFDPKTWIHIDLTKEPPRG